jgi:D-alanyl-D-alanine carboxypeptidase/D-alanyl-D-alanine-endopeptidase (penicillin-binding protein 4)
VLAVAPPRAAESWSGVLHGRGAGTLSGDEAPPPASEDRDHDRILRLQSALRDIVHAAFGRLKVGLRVIEAHSGRVIFGRAPMTLMDPASNQKLLATTTALVRLGSDWTFRTEVYGAPPDDDGVVEGDLYLRGSGDPTLGARELDELANKLAARGVKHVTGGIVADPRRIGDDGPVTVDDQRPQLTINRGLVIVRVHPSEAGEAPAVVLDPPPPLGQGGGPSDFVVVNQARTLEGKQRKLAIEVNAARGTLRIGVAGRIGTDSPGVLYRRRLPDAPLTTAIFFRAALTAAGISVGERAMLGALGPSTELLVAHSSQPLAVMLRKINKESDNYEAERLLEAVGAEVLGGPATTDKGVAVLRDVISEFGLDPRSYLSKNGSGLGHANRISARAMTDLLRALYLDPRVGPELLQSLSVGGVDGTTRNRFRGLPVARHVRAKTGTLNGKSVLSGLVGDGDDVMAFSIMVQGFKSRRALSAVRGAQVAVVNMMMRYAQERTGTKIDAPPIDTEPGVDYETGGDMETEDDVPEAAPVAIAAPDQTRAPPPPRLAPPEPPRPRAAAPEPPRPRAAAPEPPRPRAAPPEPPRPRAPVARKVAARAPEETIKAAPRKEPAPAVKEPSEGVSPKTEGEDQSEGEDRDDNEAEPASKEAAGWNAQIGVGGAGAISGGDAAPGARVFFDMGMPEGLGGEASLFGTTFHNVAGPGMGNSEWTRLGASLGPRYRLRQQSFAVDFKALLAVGAFMVQGRGYVQDFSNNSVAVGAGGGVRLSLERSVLSPWIALDAMFWPGDHTITVTNVQDDKRTIPSLDLLVSLGFSLRVF